MSENIPLEKISDYKFRIPKSYKKEMLVDAIIYSNQQSLAQIKTDNALQQVANVACLPGIVGNCLAMPDIHWGYGFCIGAVAATDSDHGGVISPGGVGYDINCGIRLIQTNLTFQNIKHKTAKLADALYAHIPAGVGSKGKIKISTAEQRKIGLLGAKWAVSKGLGVNEDLECCEEQGAITNANPDNVSSHAYLRGRQQIGTLGSGNHFVEVQIIDKIFNPQIAEKLDLSKNQITIMIHSGSRGLGHQICTDYLKTMINCSSKYKFSLPDSQLACAPLNSPEAKQYVGAMNSAANYAWANRQALTHLVRTSFEKIFSDSWQNLKMNLIYDVAHNVAKFETHSINNKQKTLCVHRKGATRSLGPNNCQLPKKYLSIGQPVIIPGSMGSSSYLLVGTKQAEMESFSSTCHGAGRRMSRLAALKTVDFKSLINDLAAKGIELRAANKRIITEEAPSAYKDIHDIVDIVDSAGLSQKVCRMRPLCVIKG